MPSRAPPLALNREHRLAALGAALRERRLALGVPATVAAEAAGMSRVTWHRIERGEPSVTMGAWLGAAAALGVDLAWREPSAEVESAVPPARGEPDHIRLGDYPQLARLAWQRSANSELTLAEALQLYERNWRHVDTGAIALHEQKLIDALAQRFGGGRLLVRA